MFLIKWACPVKNFACFAHDSIIMLECNPPFNFSAYAPDSFIIQLLLVQSLKEQEKSLALSRDDRADSPGHSAKNGS